MVRKEVVQTHRNTNLKSGLIQFSNMREKQREEMLTVCCLAQKLIRQFVGLEMNWGLPEKILGQNLK